MKKDKEVALILTLSSEYQDYTPTNQNINVCQDNHDCWSKVLTLPGTIKPGCRIRVRSNEKYQVEHYIFRENPHLSEAGIVVCNGNCCMPKVKQDYYYFILINEGFNTVTLHPDIILGRIIPLSYDSD